MQLIFMIFTFGNKNDKDYLTIKMDIAETDLEKII